MTPEEKTLIEGVFQRLQQAQATPVDQEADAAIQDGMRATPHAAYNLVRTVLLLEEQIRAAEARIRTLEQPSGQGDQRSGSFLGHGSVPQVGSNSVWNRGGAPSSDRDVSDRYGQSPYQGGAPMPPQGAPAPAGPWTQPSPGGSFLGGIASTAAGVAGGMLAANALSHLFGSQRFGGAAHAAMQDLSLVGGDYGQSPAASALGIDDIGRAGGADPSYAGGFGGPAPDQPGYDAPDYDAPPDDGGYEDDGGYDTGGDDGSYDV